VTVAHLDADLEAAAKLADGARRRLSMAARLAPRRVHGAEDHANVTEVLTLVAEADEALYESRLALDSWLRHHAQSASPAPRPVIVAPTHWT
jgi:hypothetical protein